MRNQILGFVLALAIVVPAFAQIEPNATQQLANGYREQMMLQTIQQTNRNQVPRSSEPVIRKNYAPPRNRVSSQTSSGQNARINTLMQQLAPEHNRRVREDGQVSANQWLAKKAREMGRRDGQASRQQAEGQ